MADDIDVRISLLKAIVLEVSFKEIDLDVPLSASLDSLDFVELGVLLDERNLTRLESLLREDGVTLRDVARVWDGAQLG